MSMIDCETVDDILSEFAKRDPDGYVVWGQKIGRAYREEAKNRENESLAANNLNDALNAEVKRLTAEIERLRALVGEMLSHIEELYQCQSPCDRRCLRKKESCEFRARRELIAKARKEVKE